MICRGTMKKEREGKVWYLDGRDDEFLRMFFFFWLLWTVWFLICFVDASILIRNPRVSDFAVILVLVLRSSSPLIRFRIQSVFFSSLKLFLVIAFWFELQEGERFDDEDSLRNLRISGIRVSFCEFVAGFDRIMMKLTWIWRIDVDFEFKKFG
jgi:hypothetical protein